MTTSFTVAFICHNDINLLEKTIPQNIKSIRDYTQESFDTVLVVDGAEKIEPHRIFETASKWEIDEIRFRKRYRNCVGGDPSNNGHFHLFSDKTPYLMTFEGDVALFKTEPGFDILREFRLLFERHDNLALATRIDDHDCWVWKLEDASQEFEPGVRSVNRVSSHFLVYDTHRFRHQVSLSQKRSLSSGRLEENLFFDDGVSWFNYEDFLSDEFSKPSGKGIAFVEKFPIRVYHCDKKISSDSVHYTKDEKIKIEEFDRRASGIH